MMPGSKGQKAVHACMIRLLNLGPAKHEEGVICVANQRIPNVCRIAGAACCGAIRGHQLGAKDLLTPTSFAWELICYCYSAPFAKPSEEGFTALSALSAAAQLIFASARRNAHGNGAPFVHSCRQIFMRDRKKPTRMCE